MSTIFIISNPVIAVKPIPINTDTKELKLCFTISVSLVASSLGYFKFTIIPIVSDTIGNMIEAITISKTISKLNEKNVKIIMSPIKIQGIIIVIADITLYNIISFALRGKLFKMLNVFPSSEIMELVIDVIKEVKQTAPNKANGK